MEIDIHQQLRDWLLDTEADYDTHLDDIILLLQILADHVESLKGD